MSGALLIAEFETEDILDQPIPGIANRDFAVRAVNAHDELVELLRFFFDRAEIGSVATTHNWLAKARALIANLDAQESG